MQEIQHDFLPQHLLHHLAENNFNGCIAVQARQSEEETGFLIQLANENECIKGIVGWVDLQSANIEERLYHYRNYKKLKGFRHILQGEKDRALMLQPAFKTGISHLKKLGFTYDILIFPDQLKYVPELVAAFPEQLFVIDHLAKPYIKKNEIRLWKKDMEALAVFENLYCKISGMVTESDWKTPEATDFKPYVDTVLNAFSVNRVMFGSDWPVCLVAASYNEVCNIVHESTAHLSGAEKELLWGITCAKFYNI